MKKILTCLMAILLIVPFFTACSSKANENSDDKLSIVVTNFPQYDWLRQILGIEIENVELTLLIDSGVDLHNFQPSVEDIAKINDSDMFIYIGGESDTWVESVLKNISNDTVIIRLMDVLGDKVKEVQTVEGMEEEHEESHIDELDEHVWLSLKNAQFICSHLAVGLGKLDIENESIYRENAKEYNLELGKLDQEYKETIDEATFGILLFGDRFPFRYLADDYDLDYYAAFAGCSAETEASFETIIFLANKVDELALSSVMVIEGSNQAIAKTIIQNTASKDQSILVLNSMQAVTGKNISDGVTYISIIKSNLEVLKKALY